MPATDHSTEHRKKTFAEKVSNGVHHLGAMLTIPTYEALDTYFPDPDREEPHETKHTTSTTMHKLAHTAGQLVSIPKQEAIDACANPGIRRSHDLDHDHHTKSLSERISSGVHHMGEILSVPTYEAIDACAHVSHHEQPPVHSQQNSGNAQKMCRTLGAMLSVPICEAVETCGNGPNRGH